MNEAYLITFAQNSLMVTVFLAAPVLIVSLVIGSLISLVQAATQVNEVTLTFVPKMIGVIVILVLMGGWMGQQIINFTTNVFTNLPNLVH